MVKTIIPRKHDEKAKIITNNNPAHYLWQLDCDDWQIIKMAVAKSLFSFGINPNEKEFDEEMTIAMSGRVCDLEDTIEIEYTK